MALKLFAASGDLSGTPPPCFLTAALEWHDETSAFGIAPARVGRSITALPLKTGAAQDRTAQVRMERNGRGNAAFRAGDAGFYAPTRISMLCLARFAAPRLILQLLFPEKELLAGAEDELLAAIDAFQQPVGEFHRSTSPEKEGHHPGFTGRRPLFS
jgi:hypothetical protein